MEYSSNINDSMACVKISGQFTFADTQKFKNILDTINNNKINSIKLDISDTTFIDSSSMGMLLLLRDECESRKVSLNLSQPQGQVEKIFRISKFYDLFSIC
ncbi:MAG: STAS domain-containing protein [Rickettsiales bacterium]